MSGTPSTFVPRLLMPRSCLPLALLDVHGITEGVQANRIFSAQISSLEASLSPKQHATGPIVLIAQCTVTPCLYAVEHVRLGVYALCKLCAWVKLKDLEILVLESKTQPDFERLEQAPLPGDKWWHKAVIGEQGAILATRGIAAQALDDRWISIMLEGTSIR